MEKITDTSPNGFTLIELMMVISIIGILSAVVLAALNQSRVKGLDTAIKSDLVNIRSQIEVYYYSNNGETYGTWNGGLGADCPTSTVPGSIMSDPTIVKAINSALDTGRNGSYCIVTPTAYAISVGMKSPGQSWCIDSNNISKQYPGTPTAAITGLSCS